MRTSAVIASFAALAACAPLDLPALPSLGNGAPSVPELGLPSLPELELPSLPETGKLPVELPELPVKRDGLGIPAVPGVGLPEEVKDLLDSVELPVKRDGLGIPAVPGVGLPEEVKNLLDEVKLPVKRDDLEVEVDVTLPDIEVPEVEVPEVPEVEVPEVPEVEVPEVEVPEVKRAVVTDPEVESTIHEVIEKLTALLGDSEVPEVPEVPELPVKRDGLGIPAVPGVALPDIESLGLDSTVELVINILTGLLE